MKTILIQQSALRQLEMHCEATYPHEGAGFLLGHMDDEATHVHMIMPLPNRQAESARHNRYVLEPRDYVDAENEADARGLALLGVFHSHPDHPARPSDYDRDHALPSFIYLITSVRDGRAIITRGWLLQDDRSAFDELALEPVEAMIEG